MSFPRYPAYKPSGVEWLGEVPEHWDEKPLKTVASLNDEVLAESISPDYELEYVDIGSVSLAKGIESTDTMAFVDAPSRARRVPRDGDVLVSTVRTYLKAIAPVISPPSNLVASTGFAVVRPRSGLQPGFLKYALQEEHFIQQVISQSTGIRYPAINASDIARISLCMPGSSEQQAIATFLDRETAKIDALIAEQQRLIELLQQKRQAVISHAVTKGLNPHAPMKDSGVEWLGEVPEHWSIGKLSYIADVIDPNPSHRNPVYTDGGYPFISTVEFRPSGKIEFDTPRRVAEETVLEQEGRCGFRKGSLAFSRKGTIGAVRELPTGLRFALLDSLCVINPSSACTSDFLQLNFESTACSKQLESMIRGAALPQVSVGDVRRMLFPCPPAKEQQEIVNYLLPLLARFDMLIDVSAQSGALLAQRRSALISAAVTGQIDVRGLVPEADTA
jgi:type I restriction enzyme S subunit